MKNINIKAVSGFVFDQHIIVPGQSISVPENLAIELLGRGKVLLDDQAEDEAVSDDQAEDEAVSDDQAEDEAVSDDEGSGASEQGAGGNENGPLATASKPVTQARRSKPRR